MVTWIKLLFAQESEFGVANAIAERWSDTEFVGRTTWGYDLTENGYKAKLAEKAH